MRHDCRTKGRFDRPVVSCDGEIGLSICCEEERETRRDK
jgi:hypothetical protein